MDEIIAWLGSLGLSEYATLFAENRIDASVLHSLTEQDLKDLGIARFGDRRKLALAIAERVAVHAQLASAEAASTRLTDVAMAAGVPRVTGVERRHLTVMFCDLVGSTALAATLDPEDMREVVRAYQGACAQAIGRYEGFVAQYLGDGVMAYFGYPQAHEDDAERAVRAGLDLIAAVAALGVAALGERGYGAGKIEVRIGIATGLVVVGDLIGEYAAKERAVTGETPNLAARLQGLAAPGSIVVSAATRRLLGGMFDLHDLGPQSLKGLDAPVQAFAIDGLRSFESRFEARAGGLTGFVGREDECEHMVERWKLARQGRGQVVLVSGEAGIGKSRLTAWLVDKVAGEPHTRLRYQCTPHHKDSALYPTIAQIERAAGIEPNEPGEAKLAKLEQLLMLGGVQTAETVPLFAALLTIPTGKKYPPLAMSPGRQRQRTLAALLDQVEALARRTSLLMLYEDAHWADATSLEWLDTLVDRLASHPVMLVISGRPEFSPGWAGRHNVSTVTLEKLDKRDTRDMVQSITGGAVLPVGVLDQIVKKTDGVPLFIEELTKTVLESGALAEGGAGLTATAALPIPATLQDSLMARLDRSNPVKEIAQIAATIGREFSYRLLVAVAGMDEATLRAGLAKLEEAELAGRRGIPPDATYTFKHALVQDAAYESQLKSRRQTIHRRVAKTLRDRFPLLAETEPETIAHHFTQANRPVQAVDWWTRAGHSAVRRTAYVEAISHFEKAIAIADGASDVPIPALDRFRLQVAYGNALIPVRNYSGPETIAAFSHCERLGERISDKIERFSGFYGLWVGSFVGGRPARAHAIARSFLEELGPLAPGPETAVAGRLFGSASWGIGDFGRAIEQLEVAIVHYDFERDKLLAKRFGQDVGASIMVYLAMALQAVGLIERARVMSDRAVSHAERLGDCQTLAFAHWFKCFYEAVLFNWNEVLVHGQRTLDIGRENNLSTWIGLSSPLVGWALWHLGEKATGRAMVEEGGELRRRIGHVLCEPLYAMHVADILAERDPEGALRRLEQLLDHTAETGEQWLDAEIHRRCAETAVKCRPSRAHEAERALKASLVVARAQGARTFELRASLDLARLYRDTGRQPEAVPLLQGALTGFEPTPELPEIAEAQRLLASNKRA